MKRIIPYQYTLSILLTFVLLACSTEKNTFVNRNFHNLNAHYNVYFNGYEAMKMGLEKIDTQVEEDYTKILPVFKESLPETETQVMGDMTTAIEKATKLIKRHSITAAPEKNRKQQNARKRTPVKPEYNKWVDDAYLMMGRAYLYQKDYIRAASTFTQMIRIYKDDAVQYDAYLWLIRTFNEAERYTEARELVESLEGNNLFPKNREGELAINAADLHLKQQHYNEAIHYLDIGIKKIKGNQRKVRYTFILAQLYEETGNKQKALETYRQVIRRRPEYEMLFNAQINMASALSGDANVSELRKQLNKMRKKKRNEAFLDQIYFALGNILYNEGKITDAIEMYKQSAAVSVNNSHQRALSCLTLADLYFDQKAYIPSGLYYDSAMVEIDQNYPNYKAIAEKHTSLSLLVTNLLEIETQDSLQTLAGMSEQELDQKIQGWIALEKAKIAAQETESMDGGGSEYDMAYGRATSSRMRVNSGNSWYYYNPSTVSYGKKEFERLWGSRKNEDDWRRKNKAISMTDAFGEPLADEMEALIEEETITRVDDKTTAAFYKQDIPNNDSLMALSHQKIKEALFNAGTIFKTDFNDYERSIECFNELNRRYPENPYALPSYFHLWDLYQAQTKPDSASIFREKILRDYPESNYAKYLVNPNFFLEEEARKDSVNTLYSMAFNAYKNHQYASAIKLSKQAESMDPDSALLPKIKFIQLVATTKGMDNKIFADALQEYINQYPGAETSQLAQSVLKLVEEEKLTNYDELINTGYLNEVIKNLELMPRNQAGNEEIVAKWDADPLLLHYFVIAIPSKDEIDINRLKFDIANYNIDHYTTLDFDIETENLNPDTRLLVVRNFDQKESALIYFLSIIRKPGVFKTLAGIKFLNFIISNNNYREMLNDRSYNEYLQFFVKNYSSFTSGEFLEEELESPEALMARLKQDDVEAGTQGEFVVVKTSNAGYVAPTPKAERFMAQYDAPHSYMLMIDSARYRTGFVMRDLVRFNNEQYRAQRLRVLPTNLPETTLLLISSFENAWEASQYMKAVSANASIFSTLEKTPYAHYIISNQQLDTLRTYNNPDEWKQFFQRSYSANRIPQPAKASNEQEPAGTSQAEQTQATENQATPTKVEPEPVTTELPVQETVGEATESTMTDTSPVLEDKGTTELTEAPTENVTAAKAGSEEMKETEEAKGATESYEGPFVHQPDAMHHLIYLLPTGGSNLTLLTTYLGRFNAMKYRSANLEIKSAVFDDYRSILEVNSFADAEKAAAYATDAVTDSRVSMSLRNVNSKSFLISTTNLEKLKTSKDLQGYQQFYTLFYKE
ncbi:MAG: tetratricopeptide repeat protein [Prolixibacteraceae bacterium]|nr:tetratricopeptide repeat protein [Prolixibacteraceae bacterium]